MKEQGYEVVAVSSPGQALQEVERNEGVRIVGYDYVVDDKTGKGKIIEISYGFSHEALLGANGHFDRDGNWNSEPLNAPVELLKNLMMEKP